MSKSKKEVMANLDTAKALAERGSHEVAVPAAVKLGGSFEGMMERDTVSIPFLGVLQPLSPQVNPSDPKYVEGAKPGQIYNTAEKTALTEVQVVVCAFNRSFIEWVPRDAGGGFRGEMSGYEGVETFMSKLDRATGKARLDNGNDLVDSRNYYLLIIAPDGTTSPAMISMSSTQIKASKDWNYMLSKQPLPEGAPRLEVYHGVYTLRTVLRENKKGKWFGWDIRRVAVTPPAIIAQAEAFRDQITGGLVTVDRSVFDDPAHGEQAGDDM